MKQALQTRLMVTAWMLKAALIWEMLDLEEEDLNF